MTLVSRFRRIAIVAILATFVVGSLAIWNAKLQIFYVQSPASPDTFTAALYVLSTLVQSTASITGVTIAVLFLTAQLTARPGFVRTLVEVYADPTILILIFFLLGSFLLALALLSRVVEMTSTGDYRWIDFGILSSATAVLLLAPAVVSQIENINPHLLGVRLTRRITARRIRAYGLTNLTRDPASGEIRFRLEIWGQGYGRTDPLGAFHEVAIFAVQNRDRMLFSGLIQLLLGRIARYAGVHYPAEAGRPSNWRSKFGGIGQRLHLGLRGGQGEVECVAVALHILHYVIRRSRLVRSEWGNLDPLRQLFVRNIHDLLRALVSSRDTDKTIGIGLWAVAHVCLGYADLKPQGRNEPLRSFYSLAAELSLAGRRDVAILCARILALLVERTSQLDLDDLDQLEKLLPDEIALEYRESLAAARATQSWLPQAECPDPWLEVPLSY